MEEGRNIDVQRRLGQDLEKRFGIIRSREFFETLTGEKIEEVKPKLKVKPIILTEKAREVVSKEFLTRFKEEFSPEKYDIRATKDGKFLEFAKKPDVKLPLTKMTKGTISLDRFTPEQN